MKGRGTRFRWVVVSLLLVAGCSWWMWQSNRPRMKQYVLKESREDGKAARTGIKFMYPADFRVIETGAKGNYGIGLTRIPRVGLAAWAEELLHKGQVTGWNNTVIVIQYQSDGGNIKDVEGMVRSWFDPSGKSIRRERYPLGPAVVFDGPITNGDAMHVVWLFPEASPANGVVRPSRSHVMIMYESTKAIEPQVRRTVDELVSSMQIVPL